MIANNNVLWFLGDPQHVVWIALFVYYIAYRTFRIYKTNHKVGCVCAIIGAMVIFVSQVAVGNTNNPNETLFMVMSMAGFGYAVGSAIGSESTVHFVVELFSGKPSQRLAPEKTASQRIQEIQSDLERQIATISSSTLDEQAKEDLIETAKQSAVELMARELEDDLESNRGR